MSIQIFNYYFHDDLSYQPLAMAALTVVALFSILVIGLYFMLAGRLDYHKTILDRKFTRQAE